MSKSKITRYVDTNDIEEDDFESLFNDLEKLNPFDIKKQEVAAQLAALLSFNHTKCADFSKISGWSKSRVSNVLNGDKNLTFKTLWEFSKHLGYEADLVFRKANEMCAMQPWHKEYYRTLSVALPDNATKTHVITSEDAYKTRLLKQTVNEVFIDMISGNNQSHYFSLMPDHKQVFESEVQVLPYESNDDILCGSHTIEMHYQ